MIDCRIELMSEGIKISKGREEVSMEKIKNESPHIVLPDGKKIRLSYLSRVANGEKPITLDQLEKTHMWSTLDEKEGISKKS